LTEIVVEGEEVVSGSQQVVINIKVRARADQISKYLTILEQNGQFTLSAFNNGRFKDWEKFNQEGVDAPAFLITGWDVLRSEQSQGDTTRQKQIRYLFTHFRRTETGFFENEEGVLTPINPSSCLITPSFDWVSNPKHSKHSRQFQAYRYKTPYLPSGPEDEFEYGYEVIETKNKLRGRGKSVRLLFETEPEKDLHIYGWAMEFLVNEQT